MSEEILKEEETQEQPLEEVEEVQQEESPESLLDALKKEKEEWGLERQKSDTRNSILSSYLSQFNKPQEPDPYADIPDDHYFTKKDIMKLMSDIEGKFEKRNREAIGRESLKRAKAKYPNFDELMSLTGEIIKDPYVSEQAGFGNMDVFGFIDKSEDPAESIAKIAMFHPSYKAQVQKETTQKTIDKIEQNLSRPKTLADAPSKPAKGKGDNSDNAFDWSKERFEKERSKILNGGF